MAFPINEYPYTDIHEMNMDYVLQQIRNIVADMREFKHLNSIKIADPIAWNITSAYEPFTIVIDSDSDAAYLSIRAVPAGISVNDSEYWTPVFNLSSLLMNMGVVIPEMFGAVGDGVTDDAAAFIAATEKYKVIGYPGKRYYIGSLCTLKNSVENCAFILKPGFSHILTIDTNTFKNNDVCVNLDEYTPDMGRGGIAIGITDKTNVIISDNTFHDMINVIDVVSCTNVLFTNNIFEHIVSTDVPGGNGYGILLYDNENVTISNNIFKNVYRHSVYVTLNVDEPSKLNKNVFISNNMFKCIENQSIGWLTGYEASINVRSAQGCKISNNTFDNVISGVTFVGQTENGISVKCSDCSVEDNTFTNIPQLSLQPLIHTTFSTSMNDERMESITVSGNIVKNCGIRFFGLDGTENATLKGNTFESTTLATNSAIFGDNGYFTGKLILIDNSFDTPSYVFRLDNRPTDKIKLTLKNNVINANALSFTGLSNWLDSIIIEGNEVVFTDTATYIDSFGFQEFDGSAVNIIHAPDGTVLENLPQGLYWVPNGSGYPSGAQAYGFVLVIKRLTYKKMFYSSYGTTDLFMKTYYNGTWTPWKSFTMS